MIEKREWFDEQLAAAGRLRDRRAHPREAIRDHPELLGAYLALDSAKKLAAERFEEPRHRDRFLVLVREVLARTTERGMPAVVKLKERAKTPEIDEQPTRRPERDPPTR